MASITSLNPASFDDGKPVTLTGSGFGASQGSVLIGGVAQNVNTWSDTTITFTTVRGSQSPGSCRVDVVAGTTSGYTPTVVVTNQAELNTELAKSAAALEGAVIGVQYNATPYVINRTGTPNLNSKDFGTGGLVICQSGATMPVFSSISIDDSRAITLYKLEIHQNTDGTGAPGLLSLYDNAWDITVDSCVIHGKYYDPNGDYTASGSYAQVWRAISSSTAAGKYLKNITIRKCEMYDLRRGHALSVAGNCLIEENTYHDLYEDPISNGYNSLGVTTSTQIKWNTFYRPIGKSSDVDNPHFDFIQFLDPGVDVVWTVNVIGNMGFIGNARGDFQGIFCNLNSSGAYIAGDVKGNLILNNSTHGITIDRASSLTVIGNTCVSGDVNGGGLNSAIAIGGDQTTGTHIVKNNVSHSVTAAGSPTISNNHTATRSTAAYAALFTGTAFDKYTLSSRAAVLSGLAMKAGGALDQTINIGAVGSGYVDYDARTINGAME